MSLLSLIARLGLDKTGFDAGLASASKSAESFGSKLSHKLGAGFAISALFLGLRKISQSIRDVAADSEKANEEFAKIGVGLDAADVALIKEYADHWGDLGIKIKYAATQIGLFVAANHEDAADIVDRGGGYLGAVLNFLNPFSQDSWKERRGAFGEISARKRTKESGGLLLQNEPGAGGFNPDSFENRKRLAQIHMAIQERILELDKNTADLEEKVRIGKLTTAQRLLELTKERSELERQMARNFNIDENPDETEQAAKRRNRLAVINDAISQLEGKKTPPSIQGTELGRIGAFQGAAAQGAQAQLIREHIAVSKSLLETVRKGIRITDIR